MSATIFAPATARGRAGVMVIRVSGPDAGAAAVALTGASPPAARKAVLRVVRDPTTGEMIDRGLVIWFPAPGSFTGEDVVELHLHGGRAVATAALDALGRLPGLSFAEAGGFARQAFRNGRLDLTAVEALGDLVDAETAAQRRQAQRQLEGDLAGLYLEWRGGLIRSLAHLEAYLDFPEDDLPDGLLTDIRHEISELEGRIQSHLKGAVRGERLRDGVQIAVVGPPNAGKSSLVNALAKREVAIVAAEPGTTRDMIEVHLDLAGYPVTLIDTAGLRTPAGPVEAEGIRRARSRAEAGDLRLVVLDGADPAASADFMAEILRPGDIIVLNKSDLLPGGGAPGVRRPAGVVAIAVSALRGDGLDSLCAALSTRAGELVGGGEGDLVPTRARHRLALEACNEALIRAEKGRELELVAEDLRLAAQALGRIVGVVDVEDILDVVFHDLCIGK